MNTLEIIYLLSFIIICVSGIVYFLNNTKMLLEENLNVLLGNDDSKIDIEIMRKYINQLDVNIFNMVAIYNTGDVAAYKKAINFIYENKGEQHRILNHFMMLENGHKRIN